MAQLQGVPLSFDLYIHSRLDNIRKQAKIGIPRNYLLATICNCSSSPSRRRMAAPPFSWTPPPRLGFEASYCSKTWIRSTPVGNLLRAIARDSPPVCQKPLEHWSQHQGLKILESYPSSDDCYALWTDAFH